MSNKDRIERPARSTQPVLSDRECEVLSQLAAGKTHAAAGIALGISERTILHHVAQARRKLDSSTRVEAVAKAVRLGLI